MSEPFKPEDVLYRFTPTEEEREQIGEEDAEECVVVRNPAPVYHELSFYCHVGMQWRQDEFGADIAIARLLTERVGTEAVCQAWRDSAVKLGDVLREQQTTVAKAEAEREVYRAALEQYAETKNWSYYSFETKDLEYIGGELARTALEQGQKIREGK